MKTFGGLRNPFKALTVAKEFRHFNNHTSFVRKYVRKSANIKMKAAKKAVKAADKCSMADAHRWRNAGDKKFKADVKACIDSCSASYNKKCISQCIGYHETYSPTCATCFGDLVFCPRDVCSSPDLSFMPKASSNFFRAQTALLSDQIRAMTMPCQMACFCVILHARRSILKIRRQL